MTRTSRTPIPFLAAAVTLALSLPAARALAQDAGAARPSAAPVPVRAASVPAPGSFSIEGIWILDSAHSDDPNKIMEAARPKGASAGGWGGGGGGSWGGHGGGHRGGRGGGGGTDGAQPGEEPSGDSPAEGAEGERQPHANPMQRVMHPAQKVVIEMLADEVRVSEDEGAPRGYAVNDSLKAHAHELVTEYGVARWHGRELEMTQPLGQRGALIETYQLSTDGRTLTIRARNQGGRFNMPAIARVYSRYDGE